MQHALEMAVPSTEQRPTNTMTQHNHNLNWNTARHPDNKASESPEVEVYPPLSPTPMMSPPNTVAAPGQWAGVEQTQATAAWPEGVDRAASDTSSNAHPR